MASDLINKYYTDIAVNNITMTPEILDELININEDRDTLSTLNDQTRLRLKWLIKTRTGSDPHEDLNRDLREFTQCDNPRTVERRPNHWTVTITSFDDFKSCCTSRYDSIHDYIDQYESDRVHSKFCDTFFNALSLLTARNNPTDPRPFCITLRFDKRTLGLYWQPPRDFHWANRAFCATSNCACCTGFIGWSPIYQRHCDAWQYNRGTVAQDFFTDFLRTHDMSSTRHGNLIFPRVPAPAPAEPAEPAATAGKRDRSDSTDSTDSTDNAQKVRVKSEDIFIDLTSESDGEN